MAKRVSTYVTQSNPSKRITSISEGGASSVPAR
jgi:hypothetical protein